MKSLFIALFLIAASCQAARLRSTITLEASAIEITNDSTGHYIRGLVKGLYYGMKSNLVTKWSIYSTTYNSQTYYLMKNDYQGKYLSFSSSGVFSWTTETSNVDTLIKDEGTGYLVHYTTQKLLAQKTTTNSIGLVNLSACTKATFGCEWSLT